MILLGEVRTFERLRADKAQAIKPLEEASEVCESWKRMDCILSVGLYAGREREMLLNEIADCITACCDLAAALGVEDMRPYLQMAETRNAEMGRYE